MLLMWVGKVWVLRNETLTRGLLKLDGEQMKKGAV